MLDMGMDPCGFDLEKAVIEETGIHIQRLDKGTS